MVCEAKTPSPYCFILLCVCVFFALLFCRIHTDSPTSDPFCGDQHSHLSSCHTCGPIPFLNNAAGQHYCQTKPPIQKDSQTICTAGLQPLLTCVCVCRMTEGKTVRRMEHHSFQSRLHNDAVRGNFRRQWWHSSYSSAPRAFRVNIYHLSVHHWAFRLFIFYVKRYMRYCVSSLALNRTQSPSILIPFGQTLFPLWYHANFVKLFNRFPPSLSRNVKHTTPTCLRHLNVLVINWWERVRHAVINDSHCIDLWLPSASAFRWSGRSQDVEHLWLWCKSFVL